MQPVKGTKEQKIVEYCLYARKSTEDDERQAMSIDSQIKEMNDLAVKEGLFIKEILKESHSAKESGQRPVFNQLTQDLREGVFAGILTWAPDRLSRNAGDLGMLVDLMDQNKLLEIKTYSQTFHNTPNEKFLLMILCSQAKLENDQKGINVKRGIRAKCEMGWRPAMPPLGYFNRTFKDLFLCASCGASIIGEDKYRKRKALESVYHIYYHCSKRKDETCKEPYVTEEKLIKSIQQYIHFTYIAHPQMIKLTEKVKLSMERYQEMRDAILLTQDINPNDKPIDFRDYAKHIFKNGTLEEKREIVKMLGGIGDLFIHNELVSSGYFMERPQIRATENP